MITTKNSDVLKNELAVFADLGAGAPEISADTSSITIKMIRHGELLTLVFNRRTGQVSSQKGDCHTSHVSYKALIASDEFSNLRSWASVQCQLLRGFESEETMLPTCGRLTTQSGEVSASVSEVEQFLKVRGNDAVRVLLIDGPAGIGKTHFVEQLAHRRASNFLRTQQPLILHVKSRGRVLTYLQDLMAFSLQAMRLSVTYDQIPILVRHGLVQLAIDGFDELGDPNGYETAWGQIRDLVEEVEGEGTLILAGRETFIGRDRLLKAVPRLGDEHHSIGVLSMSAVEPNMARRWLRRTHPEAQIEAAEEWGLFEQDSYALRPFFLTQIAALLAQGVDFESAPPLIGLVHKMIEREINKFPESSDVNWTVDRRRQFVFEVLGEIARDIAENYTDSIDDETLMWIVDVALGTGFNSDIARMLKHRIQALAFLEEDDRKGRRHFSHSEFYNYFLCHATIITISKLEIPKFIRRGILGPDYLMTFGIVLEFLPLEQARQFIKAVTSQLSTSDALDRISRNLGSLLVASVPLASRLGISELKHFDADDAVIRGVADHVIIKSASINQLDLRECDASAIEFENCVIVTLIADDTTKISTSFPSVGLIQLLTVGREQVLSEQQEVAKWLDEHGRNVLTASIKRGLTEDVRQHGLFRLLERICRVMLRQHWIRSEGDDPVTQLVKADDWNILKEILNARGLLEEKKDKAASGPQSVFYHVKNAPEILREDQSIQAVAYLLRDISAIANAPQ